VSLRACHREMIATGPEAAKMNATSRSRIDAASRENRRKAGGVRCLLDLARELAAADIAGRRELEKRASRPPERQAADKARIASRPRACSVSCFSCS